MKSPLANVSFPQNLRIANVEGVASVCSNHENKTHEGEPQKFSATKFTCYNFMVCYWHLFASPSAGVFVGCVLFCCLFMQGGAEVSLLAFAFYEKVTLTRAATTPIKKIQEEVWPILVNVCVNIFIFFLHRPFKLLPPLSKALQISPQSCCMSCVYS